MKIKIETMDCEDAHIITDCISLELWWTKKKHTTASSQG